MKSIFIVIVVSYNTILDLTCNAYLLLAWNSHIHICITTNLILCNLRTWIFSVDWKCHETGRLDMDCFDYIENFIKTAKSIINYFPNPYHFYHPYHFFSRTLRDILCFFKYYSISSAELKDTLCKIIIQLIIQYIININKINLITCFIVKTIAYFVAFSQCCQ